MAEDNLPEQDRINIDQGNINKEIKRDYYHSQEKKSQEQQTTNQFIFSLKNSDFLQQLVLLFLIIGLLAISYLFFSSTKNNKVNNNDSQQKLLTENKINSSQKYENDINNLLVTEIITNIYIVQQLKKDLKQINKEMEVFEKLKGEKEYPKSEYFRRVKANMNSRLFCQEIYNLDIEYRNNFNFEEIIYIGYFHNTFINKIEIYSNNLIKNITTNLSSDITTRLITANIEIIESNSQAALLIGEIIVKNLAPNRLKEIHPYNSEMLTSQNNTRLICDPDAKEKYKRIIQENLPTADHNKNSQ